MRDFNIFLANYLNKLYIYLKVQITVENQLQPTCNIM